MSCVEYPKAYKSLPVARSALETSPNRLAPASTFDPNPNMASPLLAISDPNCSMVMPALLAAALKDEILPPNVAPDLDTSLKLFATLVAAPATAVNIVPTIGIDEKMFAAEFRSLPTLANCFMVFVTAEDMRSSPPITVPVVPTSVPNALPTPEAILVIAPGPPPPLPPPVLPPPPPVLPPPPPGPGGPGLRGPPPPNALRISFSVASEAAFLASTCPIPGMSIITAAMSYFFLVKCAYKYTMYNSIYWR